MSQSACGQCKVILLPIINCIHFCLRSNFEYSRCGAFVPHQNLVQLIGSNERIFGNIPEHIRHRSHNKDQIITFINDTKSRASCKCFTLILHIYVPIRLHHVLRENNKHLITSNGRRNIKLLKFHYK